MKCISISKIEPREQQGSLEKHVFLKPSSKMVAALSHLSSAHCLIRARGSSQNFYAWTSSCTDRILLLVYGLVHVWLKANASALSRMDQDHGTVRVVRVLVPQPADEDADRRPIFELPVAEDKGLLSDTFEMDYIDAEFIQED